jgi:phage FluMu gp28-like protein
MNAADHNSSQCSRISVPYASNQPFGAPTQAVRSPRTDRRIAAPMVASVVWSKPNDETKFIPAPTATIVAPPAASPYTDTSDAPEWVKQNLGFTPDDKQARVLSTTIHRGILNCTRQWGKSTISAAKAVHQAISEPGSLTVVVSPSARQSGEFVRKAAGFARKLGIKTKGDGDNEISLAFPSGSRIIGLPGTEATIRGFSAVSLLLVDEAARVDDDLYLAIRPMLAVSDGALWLMSTPHGKRGFFWEAWQNGGSDWERIRVPAPECPRITQKFLDEERKTMGDRWFQQEYLCEFTDSVHSVFDRDLVEQAFSDDVKPLRF